MSRQPQSPGCVRRGCGCLTGGPIAFALTMVALLILFPQLFSVAIAVVAHQPVSPWPLFWSVMFLLFAQLGPRLAPSIWRGLRRRWTKYMASVRSQNLVSAGGDQAAQDSGGDLL